MLKYVLESEKDGHDGKLVVSPILGNSGMQTLSQKNAEF